MPRYTKEEIDKMRADGSKGGKIASAKLTPEQRSERARHAAQARWKRNPAQKPHNSPQSATAPETTSDLPETA